MVGAELNMRRKKHLDLPFIPTTECRALEPHDVNHIFGLLLDSYPI